MVTGKTLFCIKKSSKRKLGVKFFTNHLPTFDLEVTNKNISRRIVGTPRKNIIHYHRNKKEAGKEAEIQKLN